MSAETIQRLSETEREVARTDAVGNTRHELVDDDKGVAGLMMPSADAPSAPRLAIDEMEMTFPGEGDVRLLVAKDGRGEMVGSLRVRSDGVFVAMFVGLFVLKQHRGQGVAKKLIARAEEIARDDLGCLALSCHVKPHNLIARRVYAKLGYAVAYQLEDDDLVVSKPLRALHVGIPEPIGGAS